VLPLRSGDNSVPTTSPLHLRRSGQQRPEPVARQPEAVFGITAVISDRIGVIDNLSKLATPVAVPIFVDGQIGRKLIAPAVPLPQPLALLTSDLAFVDEWVPRYHGHGHNKQPFDVNCFFCPNAIVSGHGHIFVDGKLIMSPEFMPEYWRSLVKNTGSLRIDEERELPLRRIDEPTIVFSGHGIDVYGHLLIEMLPRLMVARRALGTAASDWCLLLEQGTPAWFRRILVRDLGIRESTLRFFNPYREQIELRYAALPALASWDGWFHPFCAEIMDEVTTLLNASRHDLQVPRVFISRALFSNPATLKRRCLNEIEIAKIAAKEFGFAVIASETLSWRAQVALFHNAHVILGEFGSGLHSALFAKPGSRVGSIGIHSLAQTMIGALRQQHNAYIRTALDAQGNYSIDENLFRKFVTILTTNTPT
jgi:capsular polysaccharide biosynthesis protein